MTSILVSTQWVQDNLQSPRLRLLDATVFLDPRPDGKPGYVPRSGRPEWEAGHLPGAISLDLIRELSDPQAKQPFMFPPADLFCRQLAEKGVSDDSQVVIYSTGSVMWASRLWWMLQSVGFKSAAILDGGFAKWKAEGRPLTTEITTYPPGVLTARPVPAMWANKEDLRKTLGGSEPVCVIDALSPKDYSGERAHYGRPGHIPGSRNVFYHRLLDETTGTFLPVAQLKPLFEAVSAFSQPRVICYCGGGIASTMNAVALRLCGHPNVAIYDGSMLDWASDPSLPLTMGKEP